MSRHRWKTLAGSGGLALTLIGLDLPSACAHTDLLLQIDEVTRQIGNEPKKAELYVRRGELRRLHAEWDAAGQDYERAAALDPSMAVLDLCQARLCLESGWPLFARAFLDRFLARHPQHADAFTLRARALTDLDLRLSAAQDFTRAIQNATEPGPELFIERAHVLAGEGEEHLASAVQGLDEGIARLGSLVTLQLYAIDLELKRRHYDGALARVDRIAEKSPRKETWLTRRGEILRQAGRKEEARRAFQAALDAMQNLPATRRNVPAMQELERRIKRELEGTGGDDAGNNKP